MSIVESVVVHLDSTLVVCCKDIVKPLNNEKNAWLVHVRA